MNKSKHTNSTAARIKKCGYIIPLIMALAILFGCAQQEVGTSPTTLPTAEKARRMIEVEVVDQTVLYRYQYFWDEEEFLELSGSELEARFKEEYNVEAKDFEISFTTKCYVYGTISKSRDRYTADFLWLLRPLGLDFIDDHFKETNHGLSWQGKIDGVPATIEVKCPPQDCVYEAWQHPVGHCHGHIWWPVSS